MGQPGENGTAAEDGATGREGTSQPLPQPQVPPGADPEGVNPGHPPPLVFEAGGALPDDVVGEGTLVAARGRVGAGGAPRSPSSSGERRAAAPPPPAEGDEPPGSATAKVLKDAGPAPAPAASGTDPAPGANTKRVPRKSSRVTAMISAFRPVTETPLPAAPAARTLLSALRDAVSLTPDRPALRFRRGETWEVVSFATLWRRVSELALGLRAAGVTKDDRVLIMAENGPEVIYAELAAIACRALAVVVYPSYAPSVLRAVLQQTAPRVSIVESGAALARYLEAKGDSQDRVKVVSFGDGVPGPRGEVRNLTAVMADGRRRIERCRIEKVPDPFQQLADRTRPTDPICLGFSAGTTGAAPRGAILTHENALVEDLPTLFGPPTPDDVALIQIPLAQPFVRLVVAYGYLRAGASLAFPGADTKLIEALPAVEPTMLFVAPGVLEPLEREIKSRALKQTRWGRRLTDWAFEVARRSRKEKRDRAPWLVDRLILGRIRKHLGGRIRFVYVGGAADGDVLSFFQDVGIDTYEGYAIAEATPLVALSRPDGSEEARYGSGVVGRSLPGVEVAIDGEGELRVRGLVNMKGYWRDDAATRSALDRDGWLRTGDVGRVDASGLIAIDDRKADVFVTPEGHRVFPSKVEEVLRHSPLVREVVVLGKDRPFPVALVVPHFAELAARVYRAQPELQRKAVKEKEMLLSNAASRVTTELEVGMLALKIPEEGARPRKVRLLSMAFSRQYELSPVGSFRRRAIEGRYQSMLDALYAEDQPSEEDGLVMPPLEVGAETQEMRRPVLGD